MKRHLYTSLATAILAGGLATGCADFDEINKNPYAAGADVVETEYFINSSIIGAQMDPHIAERVFVLYWKDAGHMDNIGTLSKMYQNGDWTNDYFRYLTEWLTNINSAIALHTERKANGAVLPSAENIYQCARIWRAYLMSEFVDNFGPMPIEAFTGTHVSFNTVEEVYSFLLKELEEATGAIKPEATAPDAAKKLDPAYGYDFEKWQRYGNSLRMRLAMRIVNADPTLAKKHFESAVATGKFISTLGETFSVQEKDGWDPLTGVMSRQWNDQLLSSTLNNLYTGLGGISSERQIGVYARTTVPKLNEQAKKQREKSIAEGTKYAKGDSLVPIRLKFCPADWMGVRYEDQFAGATNDPSAGFWLDGLPHAIDPRAYVAYGIPGDISNPRFCKYPSWNKSWGATTWPLLKKEEGKEKADTLVVLNAAFTWNAPVGGSWGDKGDLNALSGRNGTTPCLVLPFRNSTLRRVFFASWESYFLIAEAAVRGWSVPMDGKRAYEQGIRESFTYMDDILPGSNLKGSLDEYLASKDYNRIGTSVAWDHTTEPSATVPMRYQDGKTGKIVSYDYAYPVNGLYKDGTVHNDHMTKILTQKFIAQVPWLPLETWSDHRRLGLPFFENPAVEKPIVAMPGLTPETAKTSKWEFFPQRLPYPTSLKNNSPKDYADALSKLNGPDEIGTPLWWAAYKK